jgi:hypothetical protein
MNMSGLKAVVLAAAVIVGGLVLMNGFSGSGASAPTAQVTPTPTPTSAPTKPPKSPKPVRVKPSPSPSPAVAGVRLGVYNATSTANLAQTAQASFQSQGYTIKQIGDATNTSKTSAVYYLKTKDQPSAQFLADKNFKGVTAAVLPTPFNIKDTNGVEGPPAKGVQIVVILGEDYKAK